MGRVWMEIMKRGRGAKSERRSRRNRREEGGR